MRTRSVSKSSMNCSFIRRTCDGRTNEGGAQLETQLQRKPGPWSQRIAGIPRISMPGSSAGLCEGSPARCQFGAVPDDTSLALGSCSRPGSYPGQLERLPRTFVRLNTQ